MKLQSRVIKRIALLLIVFSAGCVVGTVVSSYLYYQCIYSKVVDESAHHLAWQLQVLSHLRVGEIDPVVKRLEMMLDSSIASAAGIPNIPVTDHRRLALAQASAYRDIYPSKSPEVTEMLNAFMEINRHPLIGKAAPDFEAPLLDGGTFRLSDHHGKDIVILEFWSSLCGPCRAAMPVVEKVAADYSEKGVECYTVNQGDDEPTIRSFLSDAGLDVPVVVDPASDIGDLYERIGVPWTVIVGRDGTVQAVHFGYLPVTEKILQRELDMLLAEKPPVAD